MMARLPESRDRMRAAGAQPGRRPAERLVNSWDRRALRSVRGTGEQNLAGRTPDGQGVGTRVEEILRGPGRRSSPSRSKQGASPSSRSAARLPQRPCCAGAPVRLASAASAGTSLGGTSPSITRMSGSPSSSREYGGTRYCPHPEFVGTAGPARSTTPSTVTRPEQGVNEAAVSARAGAQRAVPVSGSERTLTSVSAVTPEQQPRRTWAPVSRTVRTTSAEDAAHGRSPRGIPQAESPVPAGTIAMSTAAGPSWPINPAVISRTAPSPPATTTRSRRRTEMAGRGLPHRLFGVAWFPPSNW